ncbi:MAG: hypothetical protein KGL39_59220, partial [Patescibacteria group bacterium]|nr:hypothetical protein [Patescibacteria group bacterium]
GAGRVVRRRFGYAAHVWVCPHLRQTGRYLPWMAFRRLPQPSHRLWPFSFCALLDSEFAAMPSTTMKTAITITTVMVISDRVSGVSGDTYVRVRTIDGAADSR